MKEKPIYLKKKKRKKIAIIVFSISAFLMGIMIFVAFNLFYVNGFTVTVSNDVHLFLTIDESKEITTTQLDVPPIQKAMDAQYKDIPDDVEDELGNKSTSKYFAYSFYLGSNSTINYSLSMTLNNVSNDLDDAMRVMIIRNGERTIYAKANEDGSSKLIYHGDNHNEPTEILGETKKFKDNKHIILEPYSISQNSYDRYTIVMWIDGWESNNLMRGGVFYSDVKFSTISNN